MPARGLFSDQTHEAMVERFSAFPNARAKMIALGILREALTLERYRYDESPDPQMVAIFRDARAIFLGAREATLADLRTAVSAILVRLRPFR